MLQHIIEEGCEDIPLMLTVLTLLPTTPAGPCGPHQCAQNIGNTATTSSLPAASAVCRIWSELVAGVSWPSWEFLGRPAAAVVEYVSDSTTVYTAY